MPPTTRASSRLRSTTSSPPTPPLSRPVSSTSTRTRRCASNRTTTSGRRSPDPRRPSSTRPLCPQVRVSAPSSSSSRQTPGDGLGSSLLSLGPGTTWSLPSLPRGGTVSQDDAWPLPPGSTSFTGAPSVGNINVNTFSAALPRQGPWETIPPWPITSTPQSWPPAPDAWWSPRYWASQALACPCSLVRISITTSPF